MLRITPLFLLLSFLMEVVSLSYASDPQDVSKGESLWSTTMQVWSADVKISVLKSEGISDETFLAGNVWHYVFDDVLHSRKWTLPKGKLQTVISQTKDTIYVDLNGAGTVDAWSIDYNGPNRIELDRDPRLLPFCAVNEWGHTKENEVNEIVLKKLEFSKGKDGTPLGVFRSQIRQRSTRGLKDLVYLQTRKYSLSGENSYVVAMIDEFKLEDGRVFNGLSHSSQMTYEKIDGFNLPIKWLGKSKNQVLELQLEWNEINEGKKPDAFMPIGLGLRGGTMVVDRRSEKPIVESIIARDGVNDLPGKTIIDRRSEKPIRKGDR